MSKIRMNKTDGKITGSKVVIESDLEVFEKEVNALIYNEYS